jgi:flagellar motor switch protein FliG
MSAIAPFRHRGSAPSGDAGDRAGPDLSGPQKAAVIVRFLLAQGTDLPLGSLPDHQQSALAEQLAAMPAVDRDTLAAVVDEFCRTIERHGLSFPDGLEGALRLLDGRISEGTARRLRQRAGGAPAEDPWDLIRGADTAQLIACVNEESAEVAAMVLANLPAPRAAEVLGQIPGHAARRIALCLTRTGATDPGSVHRLGLALRPRFAAAAPLAFDRPPAERMGAILNLSPTATREDVLAGLEEEDGSLAKEVRRTIFTFAHIPARIAPRDVPKILKGLDQDLLVKAFGGASGAAQETADYLLANMSQRLAGTLREEIAGVPGFRENEVEAAQTAIVLAIRELEAAGELVMSQPEAEED